MDLCAFVANVITREPLLTYNRYYFKEYHSTDIPAISISYIKQAPDAPDTSNE